MTFVSVLVGSACGSKASTQAERGHAETPDLLLQVPADTPYLVHIVPEMVDVMGSGVGGEITSKLKAAIVDREKLPASTPKERLRSELARELAPLDDKALARIGWERESSEAIVYGYGLVPVLRASMDGSKARAALDAAAGRAGVVLEKREASGVPYVVIPPTEDGAAPIVVVFHPRQIAAAWTHEPDAIVAHLASIAPVVPSFAKTRSSWAHDPDAPSTAKVFIAVDPANAAKALRAGDLARVTREPRYTQVCAIAIADFVDDLPQVVNEFWIDGDVVTHSYSIPKSALLAGVIDKAPGLPHWVADPVPDFQVAAGVELGPALALATDLWSRLQSTRSVCGRDPEKPLDLGPHGAVLAHVRGIEVVGDIKGNAVHLAGLVDVDDVAPVWAWIGPTFFQQQLPDVPVGRIDPLGEINHLEFALGRGPSTLYGSLGSHERVLELADSDNRRPVPGTLFRLHIGRELVRQVRAGKLEFFGYSFDPGDGRPAFDTDNDIDVSVRGDVLVMRQWGTMRLAASP